MSRLRGRLGRGAGALYRLAARATVWRPGLRARFALLIYAVTLLATAVVGLYGYGSAADAYRARAEELLRGHVSEVARDVGGFLDRARNDARFHTRNSDLLRYVYWQDLGDAAKAESSRATAADALRNFTDSYDHVYQNRLIGVDGHERIRVRRDPQTRAVRIFDDAELEARGTGEAFVNALPLRPGELYVSSIQLSRANGRIENPAVPLVRLATPLAGRNGVTYGVLETDLYAEPIFEHLRAANDNAQGREYFLVDPQGNYLFHPDNGKTLDHNAGFRTDFPGLLERLEETGEATLTAGGRIITYRRLPVQTRDAAHHWLLVGTVEEGTALADLKNFEWVFLGLLLVVGALVALGSRYFLDRLVQPILFATRQLQRLGQGETGVEPHGYRAQNEIRLMLDSAERLQRNMERLAGKADTIAQGDFSGEVPLLSANDRLGQALNNMTAMLRAAKEADGRRNWLKDGLGRLSQSLSAGLSSRELAQSALDIVARYLNAGRGVLYRYRGEPQELELLAGYMVDSQEPAASLMPGEGAVGQVARDGRPVILGGDGPEIPVIRAGTGDRRARFTYTYPLLREGQLLGVVELADFERYGRTRLEFLERACEIVASFLFIVGQRDEIRRLLGVSEEAVRRTREANTVLEAHRQQLLQQTEELRLANVQMEEQQQQVEQQAEELQRANAQLEEQQRQLEAQKRELEHNNAALTLSREEQMRKAEQLELASRYKSEFLANMSHELRTPLNSIILLSKMLAMNDRGRLDEEESRHALIIHQAGEELLRLIDDILDLSKVEAGHMELHTEALASDALLDELGNLFDATARSKGLELRIERVWRGRFVTDRNKLSQVLRNLLANAFKFTRQGHVTLRVEHHAGADRPIRLTVSDSGIGIPAEKQRTIFQAFQQVDGTISREFGGTGLGLTISLRYVELMGGTLAVQSEPGQGSRFVIDLPERPPAVPAAQPAALPAVADAPPIEDDRDGLVPGDTVILLVDDEPTFGQLVLRLNRQLGYRTLIAHSGEEGLRLAEQYRPHGILLDLGLPDMDGAELLHRLKTAPALRPIPVYVVSCRDKDEVALGQETVGYLRKPVDLGRLARAEAEVIRQASESGKSVLVLEGISITAEEVRQLLGPKAHVRRAASTDEALAALLAGGVVLVIVDLQHEADYAEVCRRLREADPVVQLLLYSTRDLSEEESGALKKYTDSIIVNKPQARQRLLENIERFLRDAPSTHDRQLAPRLPNLGPEFADRLAGRRILVVDDDPRNLFVITAALEQAGAEVDNALSGARALDYLDHRTPDLIFMDIMMPDMDGYETIRRLRNEAGDDAPPIVALTAKALRSDRDKALAAGASDFLAKPVDYDVLIATAARWCEGRP